MTAEQREMTDEEASAWKRAFDERQTTRLCDDDDPDLFTYRAILRIRAQAKEIAERREEKNHWRFVPDDRGGHFLSVPTGDKWYPESHYAALRAEIAELREELLVKERALGTMVAPEDHQAVIKNCASAIEQAAALRAEVEKEKAYSDALATQVGNLLKRDDDLRAEVEGLKGRVDYYESTLCLPGNPIHLACGETTEVVQPVRVGELVEELKTLRAALAERGELLGRCSTCGIEFHGPRFCAECLTAPTPGGDTEREEKDS